MIQGPQDPFARVVQRLRVVADMPVAGIDVGQMSQQIYDRGRFCRACAGTPLSLAGQLVGGGARIAEGGR
jgi:hypothetical protein